jgi:predicted anti-sigma-YlaC factor YlaD
MIKDPYEHLDAAYVLGALDGPDRVLFEEHLGTCADCRARVEEAQGVLPYLIAGTEEDLLTHEVPMPDTMLPTVLAKARRMKVRRRAFASLAGVAAAGLIALTLVATAPGRASVDARPMVRLHPSPVSATASVEQTAWGTRITLHCGYGSGSQIATGYEYSLSVRSRSGAVTTLGSWRLNDDRAITFVAGTDIPVNQIAAVDITDSDGTPLLELTQPQSG